MKKHITHILGLCLCVVVSLGGFLIGGELDSFPAFKALFVTNADAAEDTASYYYDGNSVIFSGEGTVKASWFRGNKDIVSVEIPVSVDYIEPYAFSGCTGLKSVRIGTGSGSGIGTTVGSYAFSNCKALESATILSADIGDYAFQGCSNLSDITVASCGKIGQGAFYNCSNLSLGIYDIGWVESIGADAFYGTAWYNTQSYWDNGILYYDTYLIKAKTVDGQSGKCTVKDNTVLIADSAFSNSSFASVIVPDSVRSIGNNAFSGINLLAYAGNATGSPWGAKKIAKYYDDTFVYSDENKTQLEGCLENKGNIVIPNGVTGIVHRAFSGCTGLTNITIPGSVTSIGNYAFSDCTGLTSITIPDSVTSIGYKSFHGCTGLTSVTIGNGVTNIGAYTFSDCPLENVKMGDGMLEIPSSLIKKDSLKSFIIGYGVTSIGDDAFYNCTGLTSVTIPDSVTSIGSYAFDGCTGLTSITIPDSVISIDYRAFYGCTRLTSVTIPAGVTSIGKFAFSDCTGLTEINYNAAYAADLMYSSVFYNAGTAGEGINVTFGDSVEKIPAYLFCAYDSSYRPNIKSVTIGNSVTSIGESAFSDCTGLTSVTIPDSVTSIGDHAFSDCTGLTSVTIPDSVTSIGDWAFRDCTGLTNITIPDSVTSIGNYAFSNCTGLTEINYNAAYAADLTSSSYVFYNAGTAGEGINVTFGDSVEKIPAYLFYVSYSNCQPNIKTVTTGNSVTSIGDYAFCECDRLTSVTISNSVISIGNYAFYNCTGLTSVTIGNSVTGIGDRAFHRCTSLTSITIPDSVTSIGDSAFYSCTGLISVIIPDSVTSIGNTAFYHVNNIVYNGTSAGSSWRWHAKCVNGYVEGNLIYSDYLKKNLAGCSSLATGIISIPDSVTSIGDWAFRDCTGLTNITIPDSVTSIGDWAFYNCTGLTSVTIGNSVTSIGDYAFYGCTGLERIKVESGNSAYNSVGNCLIETESKSLILGCNNSVIPDNGSVTFICSDAFYGCTGLTSITIPDSVLLIGECAFCNCTGLTSITIGNNVEYINRFAFKGCTKLTNITIPDSVTHINGSAFIDTGYYNDEANWKNNVLYVGNHLIDATKWLSGEYSIREGAVDIADGAFSGCTELTSITIPDSVTSIGNSAFSGCTGLTSVIIPDSVTSIGMEAFSGCTGLTNVIIPDGITAINYKLFYGCTGLTSVTIPYSVTSLGGLTFEDSGLTDVYYEGSESDRARISIPYSNDRLTSATWHYNSSVSDNPGNPLSNIPEANIIKGNSADNQKIYKYKTSVTFTANVPDGGKVQWYVDGKKAGTDSTLTVKDSISSYTVTVVVTDKNGNQTMDEEKVTIKNSFFDKLIWFFVHLFNPGAYDIKQ